MLLNIEYGFNAMDKVGYSFLERAVETAKELRLFDPVSHTQIKSNKMRTARAYTAWGLYCWTAQVGPIGIIACTVQ